MYIEYVLFKNKFINRKVIQDTFEKRGCELEMDDVISISKNEITVFLSPIELKIPENEAESMIPMSLLWPDKSISVLDYESHAIVTAFGGTPIEAAKMVNFVVSTLIEIEAVVGVYSGNGSIINPDVYHSMIAKLGEGEYPILIWLHLFSGYNEDVSVGIIEGLTIFGYNDIEVLASNHQPSDVLDFLYGIANYILKYDVTLEDGETIGFTEEQKLDITKSESVYIRSSEETLKIDF